ncbi:DUF2244 domain-containing protein [Marinobacter sp.]|uniref:DUF2244 domain-containing protein n=1 Tax=Marinobacter sp. TaxID=50741 RepID=UPI00384F80CE
MIKQLRQEEGQAFVLTPNRSLSWQGNLKILAGLALVSLVIVIGMVWVGAWVVLPFAGLELSAVAVAFYYTARKCQQQEVLVISPETVRLEKGIYRKQAEWALPKRYTRVHLETPHHGFDQPKLYLVHRDTRVPLGSFLNIDDTAALVSILERQDMRVERYRPSNQFWF